jgi:hypothetical protein
MSTGARTNRTTQRSTSGENRWRMVFCLLSSVF